MECNSVPEQCSSHTKMSLFSQCGNNNCLNPLQSVKKRKFEEDVFVDETKENKQTGNEKIYILMHY